MKDAESNSFRTDEMRDLGELKEGVFWCIINVLDMDILFDCYFED